jgi:hypothetical protein
MRRLPLLLFVLVFLASAATALAGSVAAGDGSLVVAGASARIIVVQGSGVIFGHITQGTLTVVDYKGSDPTPEQVSGSILKIPAGSTTQYSGTDIRFALNGHYKLLFDGIGIDISAVGKGAVSAIGVGSANDGNVGTNGGKGVPLSVAPTTLVFGASKAPNYAPAAVAKGSSH